jgi:hypothetical protein
MAEPLPAQLTVSLDMKRSLMLRPETPEHAEAAAPAQAATDHDSESRVGPEEPPGEPSPAGSPDSAYESRGSPDGAHDEEAGTSGKVLLEGELYDEYVLGETDESRTRLVTPPSARLHNIDVPSLMGGEGPAPAELTGPSNAASLAAQPQMTEVTLVALTADADPSALNARQCCDNAGSVSFAMYGDAVRTPHRWSPGVRSQLLDVAAVPCVSHVEPTSTRTDRTNAALPSKPSLHQRQLRNTDYAKAEHQATSHMRA